MKYSIFYELKEIPDLSLAKYQSLSEQGVDGVLIKMESFLRQWQKISATLHIFINFYVVYNPDGNTGEKISVCLGFSFSDMELRSSICHLVNASPVSDFYSFKLLEKSPEYLCAPTLKYKHVLKKCERVRDCVQGDNKENIPLYYVETWEGNEEGRLYDMFKAVAALNKKIIYCVSIIGTDKYDEIYQTLKKPITFLRDKTVNRDVNEIKLIKDEYTHKSRDIAAEETLKVYEEFLKKESSSPCYQGNICILSDDNIVSNLILNTICGESIKEGNWDILELPAGQYSPLDEFKNYSRIMPKSLAFWPTHYTLNEIVPFIRFPAIYEGEWLEIKKETEPKADSGELFLGLDDKAHKVSFPLELLKKHAFVCGVPGAGKTNTMLHLCDSLWNKCNIPFLVLEPAKKEYRALSQLDMEDLIIFSPSTNSRFPLTINPFEFPKGMSLSEHIQNLLEVFEGSFPLSPPLPALLDRAIEGVYENCGWDVEDINDGSREYPTMSELYSRLEYQLEITDYDGEVRGNMKSALEMRIGSLLRRDLGNVFDARFSTLSPEDLLNYPVVIEMESMGRGPSNFTTLMLCTLVREVLRVNPENDSEKPVRHVIFIEEAHNIIASSTDDSNGGEDADPKKAATNYIVQMLAEVRALREGIIIADQLPTAMAPEVLKNTNLKIVHRLTSGDDRSLIGSTMSASDSQIEELATFLPGNALITYEGLLKPFRMQIKEFSLKTAPDTNTLISLMKKRKRQRELSEHTIDIRLYKLKENWIFEWNQMLVVYDQLLTDCNRLKAATLREDVKELCGIIVKDQLGLDEYVNRMKKLIRKYRRVLDISFYEINSDDFLESMEKGIEKITKNVRSVIKTCSM